jgi:hypothetical protein
MHAASGKALPLRRLRKDSSRKSRMTCSSSSNEKDRDDSVPPEFERRCGAGNRQMSVILSRDVKLLAKEIFEILV